MAQVEIPGPDRWILTIEEAAKELSVEIPTLRAWIRDGHFPRPLKRGKSLYYTAADLAAWVYLSQRWPEKLQAEEKPDEK